MSSLAPEYGAHTSESRRAKTTCAPFRGCCLGTPGFRSMRAMFCGKPAQRANRCRTQWRWRAGVGCVQGIGLYCVCMGLKGSPHAMNDSVLYLVVCGLTPLASARARIDGESASLHVLLRVLRLGLFRATRGHARRDALKVCSPSHVRPHIQHSLNIAWQGAQYRSQG